MTVLSLHPAKILTTGEGGAVLTDDDDLAARLRRFRNHGIATELAARTRLDLRDGRARLQLPADRHRGGPRQLASSTGWRSSSPDAASSRRTTCERLAGHRYLDLPTVEPAHGPGLALLLRPAPARSAQRSTAAASSRRSAPRGSGSTSTTSRSTSTRSIASAYPGLAFPVAEARLRAAADPAAPRRDDDRRRRRRRRPRSTR